MVFHSDLFPIPLIKKNLQEPQLALAPPSFLTIVIVSFTIEPTFLRGQYRHNESTKTPTLTLTSAKIYRRWCMPTKL